MGDSLSSSEPLGARDAEDLSLAAAAVAEQDHPLSQVNGSKWAVYFRVCVISMCPASDQCHRTCVVWGWMEGTTTCFVGTI